MAQGDQIRFKIRRQETSAASPRWEEFMVPWEPHMNVISALMHIQRNPVTAAGQKTSPVNFSANCLEEVCGACTMVINGKVRQACAAVVDRLTKEGGPTVTLEPMSKFPVVRDLYVDRDRIFEDFKRVRGWIHLDGTYDLGPGPRYSSEEADGRYVLSKCMACGCCLEACPNYGEHSAYIGAAPVNQARLFNLHPTGKMHESVRLDALLGPGGVGDCGQAQNCVEVCPKDIPLTESLGEMLRATTKHAFKSLFRR